jgi:hypothetical protein
MTVWTLPRGEPMHLAGLAAICCAIPIPIRLHASCPDNFLRLCPDNCRLGGGGAACRLQQGASVLGELIRDRSGSYQSIGE